MWVEANGVMELVLRLGCCVELRSLLGELLVWVCWFGRVHKELFGLLYGIGYDRAEKKKAEGVRGAAL